MRTESIAKRLNLLALTLAAGLLFAFLLAACDQDPEPTATPMPTAAATPIVTPSPIPPPTSMPTATATPIVTPSPIPTPTPMPQPTPELWRPSATQPAEPVPFAHNVAVRVVRVTPDWHGYVSHGGGWPTAVRVRESDALKFFEVAIWDETKSIHLYEFDNSFDPYGWDGTPQQLTAARESYAIMRFDGMPEPWTDARSRFIRDAFASFTAHLVDRFPDSDHHLIYNGHGGPGGRLFGAQLTYRDADGMLRAWAQALGRPLGVIDMGGPCTKGSFSDLENFCQHARYYVASDMVNGGYTWDDWTIEKHRETDPESQYHALFAGSPNLQDALIGRINLKRKAYEYSRNNMTQSKTQQANYLYSCQAFADFRSEFRAFLKNDPGEPYSLDDDLFDYMVAHGASAELRRLFDGVFVHRADNRDLFQWEPGFNGMLMPSPGH